MLFQAGTFLCRHLISVKLPATKPSEQMASESRNFSLISSHLARRAHTVVMFQVRQGEDSRQHTERRKTCIQILKLIRILQYLRQTQTKARKGIYVYVRGCSQKSTLCFLPA